MSALIGALRVTLGIDTTAFTDGLKGAQGRLADVGKQMQGVGRTLSRRVTAPLVAAAGAIGLGVGRMAGNLAELGTQAQLAGAGVEEFQRMAFAAQTVGIAQDKLADILKDVNDKIGDFAATGAGAMADFFENIGPKVGVTAEHFKDLSGPEALQLYVSSLEKAGASQQEMTFYMEAIASDATALIPLLANSGAELERLGDRAAEFGLVSEENIESARKFREAMEVLGRAAQALGTAFVDSGVLDIMTTIIERVTEWVAAINEANPHITQFALIAGALAAALGPVLVALGLLVSAAAVISAPVWLAVAAIAGITAAVVAFWPEIVAATDAVVAFGRDAWAAIRDFVADAIAKIREFGDYMNGLRDRMLEMGRNLIDGLLEGLRERWEAVRAWFTGLADSIPEWMRGPLGIQSPSRVMAEIGRNIVDGLTEGMGERRGGVIGEVESLTGEIHSAFSGMFKAVLLEGADFREQLGGVLGSIGGRLIDRAVGMVLPGFANGTRFAPGGLALVGEQGPELVNLPRGSQVIPNHRLSAVSGGVTINQSYSFAAGVNASEMRAWGERIKRDTIGAIAAARRESADFLA